MSGAAVPPGVRGGRDRRRIRRDSRPGSAICTGETPLPPSCQHRPFTAGGLPVRARTQTGACATIDTAAENCLRRGRGKQAAAVRADAFAIWLRKINRIGRMCAPLRAGEGQVASDLLDLLVVCSPPRGRRRRSTAAREDLSNRDWPGRCPRPRATPASAGSVPLPPDSSGGWMVTPEDCEACFSRSRLASLLAGVLREAALKRAIEHSLPPETPPAEAGGKVVCRLKPAPGTARLRRQGA